MKQATVIEIGRFLRGFKAQVSTQGLHLVPRKVNLDAIARLGLTIDEVEKIILSLTYEHYSEGPEADEGGSAGDVWIFGYEVGGQGIYIKLKIDSAGVKCLSFHPADHTIRRPYFLGGTS